MQLDNDPLQCTRCGEEWLFVGMRSAPDDKAVSTLTIVVDGSPGPVFGVVDTPSD